MNEQEIEQRRKNLESLIENELMIFTRETGRVIGDIVMFCSKYEGEGDDDYFYGVSLDDEL